MTMNETPSTDVIAEILDDPSGRRRAALVTRLQGLHDDCVVAKRKPSDGRTYERLQASGVALSAAIRILETLPASRGRGN
jgi:hypothetical protein